MIEQYILENYQNSDMSIKLLSEVFDMEASLISKIYRLHTGINFSDYLLNLRMEHARHLLQSSGESIAKISQQVGYINYLSFKHAFIRSQGLSPLEYRNLYSA